ncbi:MAG: succinate dehydrogenase cytochrome b subunit, partial [Fimbriiglobus sp.]
GTALTGFVVFHMIGNLKLFYGQESINEYAYFLKHGLGPILWIARGALIAPFVLHVVLAVRLHLRSSSARPTGYVYQRPAQASLASRTMLWTGAVVGMFVLFHLAHFTLGWVTEVVKPDGTRTNYLKLTDAEGRHDVYSMIVHGFRTWWLALLYLAAQAVLAVHLSHGVQSVLQTLGLKNGRFASAWTAFGFAVAGTVFLGNAAIVVAVWIGAVPPIYPVVSG